MVFDRVRENLRKYKTMVFAELLNRSITKPFLAHRTSGTTLVAVISCTIWRRSVRVFSSR